MGDWAVSIVATVIAAINGFLVDIFTATEVGSLYFVIIFIVLVMRFIAAPVLGWAIAQDKREVGHD